MFPIKANTAASLVYWVKEIGKLDEDDVRLMVLSLEMFCCKLSMPDATLRLVSLMVKDEAPMVAKLLVKVRTAPCVLEDTGVVPPTVKLPLEPSVNKVAPLPDPPKLRYLTAVSMVVTPKLPELSVTE